SVVTSHWSSVIDHQVVNCLSVLPTELVHGKNQFDEPPDPGAGRGECPPRRVWPMARLARAVPWGGSLGRVGGSRHAPAGNRISRPALVAIRRLGGERSGPFPSWQLGGRSRDRSRLECLGVVEVTPVLGLVPPAADGLFVIGHEGILKPVEGFLERIQGF